MSEDEYLSHIYLYSFSPETGSDTVRGRGAEELINFTQTTDKLQASGK